MTQAVSPLRGIVLLGAGRVAAHLAPALVRAGQPVQAVWSRTDASARLVAASAGAAALSGAAALRALPPADLYLLCVPDDAAPAVLAEARFPAGALVAHTSGTLPLALFDTYKELRGGVFYPLQTFSPGRDIDWPAVPLCLEAADEAGMATLAAVGEALGARVLQVPTVARQRLHVAAVFAANFPNHLLGIADALLAQARLPTDLLAPLVRETVAKALSQPPFTAQTGPAVRGDASTLSAHLAALAPYPEWQALYAALSGSIQRQAGLPGAAD